MLPYQWKRKLMLKFKSSLPKSVFKRLKIIWGYDLFIFLFILSYIFIQLHAYTAIPQSAAQNTYDHRDRGMNQLQDEGPNN